MIDFKDVSFVVNERKKERKIIKNISFNFPNKGLISVLGKSGSGKSTILNLISHEIKSSSGEIIINGIKYNDIKQDELEFLKRNVISYAIQDSKLFMERTVEENIEIFKAVYGECNDDFNYSRFYDILDIESILDVKAKMLSGGEKQRFSIYLTCMKKALIYIFDEPTSSLDYETSVLVMDLLKELSKDRLVIISTHDLELIDKYHDLSLNISYGKNVNDVYSEAEEVVETKNIKSKNIFYIVRKVFIDNVFKSIMFLVALSISLAILIVSLSNLITDRYSLYYNLKVNGCYDIFIPSNSYTLESNTLFYNDISNKIDVNKFYYNCDIITYDNVFGTDDISILIGNALICDELGDNEVIFPDALKTKIYDRGIESFVIGENEIKIIDYYKTNYQKYENNHKKYNSQYFTDIWYNTVRLNYNTMTKIINWNNKYFSSNGVNYKAILQSSYEKYPLVVGEKAVNNNEVLLNINGFDSYFAIDSSQEDDKLSFYEGYLGSKILLNINGYEKEYILKGIYSGTELNEVIFLDDEVKNNRNFTDVMSKLDALSAIDVSNFDKMKKAIKYLEEKEYEIISPYNTNISIVMYDFSSKENISKYTLILSSILTISISMLLVSNSLKNEKRNIGILIHEGYPRKNIVRIIVSKICITYLLSLIFSNAFYLFYVYRNNKAYMYNSVVDFNLLNVSGITILISFGICIFVLMFAILFNYLKLFKKDNKDLLSSY